jgi:anaerobic ribonucleoside-triphosphate reductase activating protein
LASVSTLAEKLLDPTFERDGVSILGGEPFAQAEGLLALVKELRRRGCKHILCYSGYTLETLMEKARRQSAIGEVLADIDMLIDGPYVEALAGGAGAWTGSGNQRVIDMRETRRAGQIVPLASTKCLD